VENCKIFSSKQKKNIANIIAIFWFTGLAIYALKAISIGISQACDVHGGIEICPVTDILGGLFVGLFFVPGVAIADFIGFDGLRGGTWFFVGGAFLTTAAFKYHENDFHPTDEEVNQELDRRQKENPHKLIGRGQIIEELTKKNADKS
jgi:hypothetical protein